MGGVSWAQEGGRRKGLECSRKGRGRKEEVLEAKGLLARMGRKEFKRGNGQSITGRGHGFENQSETG